MPIAARHRTLLKWFLVGVVLGAIFQVAQANALGGPTGLIHAGDRHPLADLIRSELPDVAFTEGIGHDGQLFYAIGVDPLGRFVPDQMVAAESPSYRYRRILFPVVASLGGLLDGEALLWGMIVVSALSVGVATAAAADIALRLGINPAVALAVALNPGVWMSARLLTADNLALALGLAAVSALLARKETLAVVCLALAGLAKEPALAFAAGLAGYTWWSLDERKSAAATVLVPGASLLAWMAYVGWAIGNPFDASGNVVAPGAGIIAGVARWSIVGADDIAWAVLTLVALVVSVPLLWKAPVLWRWLTWSWVAVGLVASELVWSVGNNAVRTLAPILTLTAMGVVHLRSNRRAAVSEAFP